MKATFASPVAAVLLAVELLLFEWKPRSLIPVALASAVAGAVRRYIIGMGPLFPVPPHPAFIGPEGLVGCVIAGLLAGALSALLTLAVYGFEVALPANLPLTEVLQSIRTDGAQRDQRLYPVADNAA